MCFGTTYENASMYWFQVPLKLLSKNSCVCLNGRSRSGSCLISVQRAKWMNDSWRSVFSSAGTRRPTKNSSRSGSTPRRLAVLTTVSADARPSWFGSDMRAQLQLAPEGVHVGLQVVAVQECAGGATPAVQQLVAPLGRELEVGRRDVVRVDRARAHARRARDEPLVPRTRLRLVDVGGEHGSPAEHPHERLEPRADRAAADQPQPERRPPQHLAVGVEQPDREVRDRAAVDDRRALPRAR